MSPLWVVRIVKLHRKASEIEACPPPPCKLGIRFNHTKSTFCAFLLSFGLEIGLNLSEDFFFSFFALHLILGAKSD